MPTPLFPDDVTAAAAEVLAAYRAKGRMIATVESCTGGLIAGALTEIPGSSDVVAGGLITYANSAKMGLVGVPSETLKRVGAVSAETAEAMARGALTAFPDVAVTISVTGVAGPGGGSIEKPVGLVYMGLAVRDAAVTTERHVFGHSASGAVAAAGAAHPLRTAIRLATVRRALALLLEASEKL
jgi:nicotinamide-nucleotide amidase